MIVFVKNRKTLCEHPKFRFSCIGSVQSSKNAMFFLKFLIDIYGAAFLCIFMKICKRLFSIPPEFFFQNFIALQTIYDLCDPGEYSNYLKEMYLRKGYAPSNVHKLIKDLDSKIVITTNFDKLYENACSDLQGCMTFDYTQTKSIIGCIKSPESIIIKAHGSIDDTEKISLIEYGDSYDYFEKSLEELRDSVIQLREERGMP